MITVFSESHSLHHPPYHSGSSALNPSFEMRARAIHAAIKRAGLGRILPARSFSLEPIQAIHHADDLAYLEQDYQRWISVDGTLPAVLPDSLAVRAPGQTMSAERGAPDDSCSYLSALMSAEAYATARTTADVALSGGLLLLAGHPVVYALCRRPGHHAGPGLCRSYYVLNNAAIAAAYLTTHRKHQPGQRTPYVAILDLDFHHGTGTQQIFYDRRDVLYLSLHRDPAQHDPYVAGYAEERGAGNGISYTINFPLEANITNRPYLVVLEQALAAISAHMPQFLIVSMGFDTFIDDPIGDFRLTDEVYPMIARRIAALGLPTLIVQEGGYALDRIGALSVSFLQGFEL